MNMILKEDIISLTDFARNTRKHTQALKRTSRPRILTHNGRASAVMLSVEHFQALSDAAEEYEADMRLKAALEALDRGEPGIPAEVAFRQLREKAEARRKARKS
jgi:PHD/YefM family antitoxin component YafN of YafNO toxin-antitoxin module